MSDRNSDSGVITMSLSVENTERLLKNVNKAYNTEINDILLSALGLAFKGWTGEDKILINLEGHGREEILKDINITRTVGWFTSAYPVILDMVGSDDISYAIRNVKESLRRIPGKGIGYGVLKYLTGMENKNLLDVEPEISFNYLGQFNGGAQEELFGISRIPAGMSVSPNMERIYTFDINGMIVGGKLTMTFSYNKHEYNTQTVQRIIDGFTESLEKIINHCAAVEGTVLTPSDKGNRVLSIEEFDEVISNKGAVEKIYPLSGMQEGMLFNWLMDRKSSAYFVQNSFEIRGELDIGAFEESFKQMINRYDILRTTFVYDGLRIPQQVVLKDVDWRMHVEDISEMDEDRQALFVEEFKKQDRERGFDLTKDVLIRTAIIKISPQRYKFIWSFHHILLDGWCLGIIINELFSTYNELEQGKALTRKKVHQYSGYIDWLQKQAKEEAGVYWSKYLEGYDRQGRGSIP